MSLVTTFDLEIEQMDVKTTFLHGDLEEEIYMKQSKGFVVKGKATVGVQTEKIPLRFNAISKDVVPENRHMHP
jgi:hypothetical protein